LDTGDADFDRRYSITTDHIEFTREVLGMQYYREAVRNILEHGFTRIKLGSGVVAARWEPYKRTEKLDQQELESVLSNLDTLTKSLPKAREVKKAKTDDRKKKLNAALRVPLVLVAIGLGMLACALIWFEPLNRNHAFLSALLFALIPLALFLWFQMRLLRGTSPSPRTFLGILAASIFGIPLTIIGITLTLNGLLDSGDPTAHQATILDKSRYWSTGSGGHSPGYINHATIESWREGRLTESLSISGEEYQEIRPGVSQMLITTRPGRFGIEWIVDYTLEPGPGPD
jgi:hypothetical protein